MDPITLSILGGIGASAVGGGLSYFGQRSANEANAKLSREQMDWQRTQNVHAMDFSAHQAHLNRAYATDMSNSSWQRGVADMRKAGINPMLAVSQGGASSPSGMGATGVSSSGSVIPMQNEMAGAVPAINSALSVARMKADLEKIRSDTKLNQQLSKSSKASADLTHANTRNVQTQYKGLKTEESIDASSYGKVIRYLQRLNPFGHSASALIRSTK